MQQAVTPLQPPFASVEDRSHLQTGSTWWDVPPTSRCFNTSPRQAHPPTQCLVAALPTALATFQGNPLPEAYAMVLLLDEPPCCNGNHVDTFPQRAL